MNLGTAQVIRGDARHLPLADNSVDLVVTSPPYFALRSYQDGCGACGGTGTHPDSYRVKTCSGCGETTSRVKCHNGCGVPMKYTKSQVDAAARECPECNGAGTGPYAGQIGSEPTPAEFVAALLEVTAECVRVLKPSGSLWVNLGDKYAGGGMGPQGTTGDLVADRGYGDRSRQPTSAERKAAMGTVRAKSLIGIPWRYALACIDDLGLILRAEVIWSKPNGLPESVTDRVRRSHEQWFHLVKQPRYFSAVDEIREAHVGGGVGVSTAERKANGWAPNRGTATGSEPMTTFAGNPLGKLPGSVWTVPTEPLRVPDHLGIDHFAAFPTEWPRRIIQGWSPAGVCVECGEGRRPITSSVRTFDGAPVGPGEGSIFADERTVTRNKGVGNWRFGTDRSVTGYACDCEAFDGYTRPAVVLDPFGGTGTTALVAKALGRHGISVDMSADYCRLAQWRTNDRDQLAKVLGIAKAEPVAEDEQSLLELLEEGA
jgi:DNA modification methylase